MPLRYIYPSCLNKPCAPLCKEGSNPGRFSMSVCERYVPDQSNVVSSPPLSFPSCETTQGLLWASLTSGFAHIIPSCTFAANFRPHRAPAGCRSTTKPKAVMEKGLKLQLWQCYPVAPCPSWHPCAGVHRCQRRHCPLHPFWGFIYVLFIQELSIQKEVSEGNLPSFLDGLEDGMGGRGEEGRDWDSRGRAPGLLRWSNPGLRHYLPFQLTQFERCDCLFPRHVKEKVYIVPWILI